MALKGGSKRPAQAVLESLLLTLCGTRPAQARGAHGRTAAPAVADATSPTAPMATTPGPIQRSHRDSTIRVASAGGWDSWREEGEAPILAGDPYRGLTCSGSEVPLPLGRVGRAAPVLSR